jgi:dCTP deaminase
MRLGNEFIVFHAMPTGTVIDLANVEDTGKTHVKVENEIWLQPFEFLLGVTMETVHMPANMAGRLDGKSSLARLGLFIHITGGNIDPGFNGPITIELFNARKLPIILRPGLPICQIVFDTLQSRARSPYQGRYQNAHGVEASKYGKETDKTPAGNAIPYPPNYFGEGHG